MKKRKRSVHVFMCTCYRSLKAAERVGGGVGQDWRAAGMDGGGQARRGRHETGRLGDAAKKKKNNKGQQVRGGRGHEHKGRSGGTI